MSELQSAIIIPFPSAVPVTPQEDPLERLRRALLVLDEALAEQREAIAHWRGVMTDLNSSVGGLGSSLCGYQNALAALDGKVSLLNEEAGNLVAWADQAAPVNPAFD